MGPLPTGILNLAIIIIAELSQNTLGNPVIKYCYTKGQIENNNHATSPDCNWTKISASVFKFGNLDQNVLELQHLSEHKYLILSCQAPYPIRWLARQPSRSIHYISSNETNRYFQDRFNSRKSEFLQKVSIDLSHEFSRILRCESYTNSNLAAEIFLNSHHSDRRVWESGDEVSGYFLLDENVPAKTSIIIPCVAKDFFADSRIQFIRHHHKSNHRNHVNTALSHSDISRSAECVACVCQDSSGTSTCSNYRCIVENPCNTTKPWENIGRGNEDSVLSPEACDIYQKCIEKLVQTYRNELTEEMDSNGDDLETCEDSACIKVFVQANGCGGSPNRSLYQKRLEDCRRRALHNLKSPITATFDPRIGLKLAIRDKLDLESKYDCQIYSGKMLSQASLTPLNSRKKIQGNLIYNHTSGRIQCDPMTHVPGMPRPNLLFGRCNSLSKCQLRYRPLPPAVFTSVGKSWKEPLQHIGEDHPGLTAQHTHGFVECAIVDSVSGHYISEIGYFFTGIDHRKYFIHESFEALSIIKLQADQGPRSPGFGDTITFSCTISTFVLLPNIQFVISYANQSQKIVMPGKPVPGARIPEPFENIKNIFLAIKLELTLAPDIIKLACRAPRINASNWAEAKVNPFEAVPVGRAITWSVEESSTTVGTSPEPISTLQLETNSPSGAVEHLMTPKPLLEATSDNFIKIGIPFGLITLILIVTILVIIVVRRRRSFKASSLKLTSDEVEKFHFGDRNTHGDQLLYIASTAESLAFPEEKKIMRKNLHIDNTILGEGQFGIVRKGLLIICNRQVAVKSCNHKVDVDYFRAFLTEVKIMASIGEHENIVRFFGAVVDSIHKGVCDAVIELSPFGNLKNYLTRYSSKYSNESSRRPVSNLSFELKLLAVLNESILLSFCKQIAKGMAYLSEKRVIHADLATRNVLVFEGNVVKITDFGLSRKLYMSETNTKKNKAPLPWPWMALESLRVMEFSTESDVWSYGVTIWEIFSFGKIPFAGHIWTSEFVDQIESGQRLSKPQMAPDIVYKWMRVCWENNPKDRPTFGSSEAFFRNLEDQAFYRENK